MGNKIKITKEQFNRLLAPKLISESHIKDKGNDLKTECIDLIKHLYGVKKDLSPFWEQHGLTIDEICHGLLEKNIIVEKDGHYELSKKLGTPENAKEILETELKHLLTSKEGEIVEISNFTIGDNPDKDKSGIEPKMVEINNQLQTIGSNDEIQILSDGPNLYVMLYGDLSEKPLKDEQINRYVAKHKDKMGYGFSDWESGNKRIVQIDNELKNDLELMYDKNKDIMDALNSKEGIAEMTATGGASGAFLGPLSGPKGPIKRDLNTADVPVVAETTSASPATVGPYDANALPGINRDGSYKKTPKTNAEKKTQWAGGSFVNIDDCTKLNNNKTAQNGGCSQGAVDNVVKTKKTSGNINAPSLNESVIPKAQK